MTAPPTREQFLEWRSPRPGTANPERMNNPVWEWLIESCVDPYHATKQFDGPSPFVAGPGWSSPASARAPPSCSTAASS
jgi:hypothetical protein